MMCGMENQRDKLNYKEMSWMIFQEEFGSEGDCIDWLFKARWPEGFVCPKCEGKDFWKITMRGLYKCATCRHQVSHTAGTIFHKTRTPLLKWFMLIFRMASSKLEFSLMK